MRKIAKKNWNVKQRVKFWLGNQFALTKGKIKYFSTEVYFPPGHELFHRLCAQGVYEADLINGIRKHLPVDGTVFDVGANIGLTAIPILRMQPNSSVVSFEPSPNSLPFLKKTQQLSSVRNRWTIIEKAVGEKAGDVEFVINSEADGAFDGRQSTGRRSGQGTKTVPMTTLDIVWEELGNPRVAVIKIDVEGFEKEVLAGAGQCIAMNRPVILLEWSHENLVGLGRDPLELIEIAEKAGYETISMASGRHIPNSAILEFEMLSIENFILFPRKCCAI